MGSPDPAVFYGTEGLEVTTSVYQGLLQYANNSTKIIPDLAKSYQVSPNGLTYTFDLQQGVTFHDGTPFTSAAVVSSFARDKAVGGGPAYMVAHVTSIDTPNPLTAVIHLDTPISAFLDYMASPYGPNMYSPTAIQAHTVNGDEAQTWLLAHDAGTGPYEISAWLPNQHYVLTRYAHYWGRPPSFGQVVITIVPDLSIQQIELEQGQLDIIFHGLLPAAVNQLKAKSGFQVHSYSTELLSVLYINALHGPFVTQAARQALEETFGKATLTKEVFGSAGTVSRQVYPAGELPSSDQSSVVPYRPATLAHLVPKLSTNKVEIGYDATDARNVILAELVGAALDADGMQATTVPVSLSVAFGWPSPDDSAPDGWSRTYYSKGGGSNLLNCYSNKADNLMNQGLAATSKQSVDKAYGEAGNVIVKMGCDIDIADVNDDIVSRDGLSGFYHVPSIPWAYNLDYLKSK
jgi:peptide/nickel transport system substrate-binding protein